MRGGDQLAFRVLLEEPRVVFRPPRRFSGAGESFRELEERHRSELALGVIAENLREVPLRLCPLGVPAHGEQHLRAPPPVGEALEVSGAREVRGLGVSRFSRRAPQHVRRFLRLRAVGVTRHHFGEAARRARGIVLQVAAPPDAGARLRALILVGTGRQRRAELLLGVGVLSFREECLPEDEERRGAVGACGMFLEERLHQPLRARGIAGVEGAHRRRVQRVVGAAALVRLPRLFGAPQLGEEVAARDVDPSRERRFRP